MSSERTPNSAAAGDDSEEEYYTASEDDDGENSSPSNEDRTQGTKETKFLRTSVLSVILPELTEKILSAEKKLEEISRWLAPFCCLQKHKDTHKLRQKGTCKWFPNTDAYKEWRFGVHRLLWLHGKGVVSDTFRVATADNVYPSTCL